jgi:hypothetical protein
MATCPSKEEYDARQQLLRGNEKYRILVGSRDSIEDSVNGALLDGWRLHGSTGFNTTNNQFFQVVVKD